MKPGKPSNSELAEFRDFSKEQTQLARHKLRQAKPNTLDIDTKADHSLVTELDREIELRIRENITKHFPEHGIIGEEFPPHLPASPYQWIIDPIDGTQEFANGSGLYGFLLSLNYIGQPLLGIIDHPALGLTLESDLTLASRCNEHKITLNINKGDQQGIVLPAINDFKKYENEITLFEHIIREYDNYRVFRSCYGHTSTILGHTSLTLEHDLHIWDFNSSRILIEQAGGRFEILRQRTPKHSTHSVYSIVFGTPKEVQRFISLFGNDYNT